MRTERRDQPLVKHQPRFQPRVGATMTDEPDVDLAADQRIDLIRRRHVAQMELDVRMRSPKP